MRPVASERGVATWRPLLGVDKADIYAAAAALALPHLADSTDPACDRGPPARGERRGGRGRADPAPAQAASSATGSSRSSARSGPPGGTG